ncbi:MAG: hypothetical protein Q8R05_02530 [Candidatus Omnitrophota bacterium]|nr:hypothetical protein [Candidatus Omnitrophota bacterium]
MRYFKYVFVLGVLLLPLSTLTYAQEPVATQTIELSKDEPTIAELQRAAIRYAEVEPGKITNWRRQAALKAVMPKVSVGYDSDIGNTIDAYNYGGKTTYAIGPDDESHGWDVSASWDLGDLIYNDDQTSIDSRSKLMVQLRNDVLDQLNTAYFERKKLQRQLQTLPDKTSSAYLEREIRIEELTATIDGLTGGYLSRRLGKD